jgi:hypothetical protein
MAGPVTMPCMIVTGVVMACLAVARMIVVVIMMIVIVAVAAWRTRHNRPRW